MKILSKIFVVAIVVTLASSLSSCKKDCFDCTGFGVDITYCEDDLGKTATDAAVLAYELGGGTCTKQ